MGGLKLAIYLEAENSIERAEMENLRELSITNLERGGRWESTRGRTGRRSHREMGELIRQKDF